MFDPVNLPCRSVPGPATIGATAAQLVSTLALDARIRRYGRHHRPMVTHTGLWFDSLRVIRQAVCPDRESPSRSTESDMKNSAWGLALASLFAVSVGLAQTPAVDKATAKAERRAQGAEAARSFSPGEGNPKPEPRARVSKADRASASQARKPAGIEAARTFKPGEGDPKPVAMAKLPRTERSMARKASRAEVARLNKSGQLPSYGENYGGK